MPNSYNSSAHTHTYTFTIFPFLAHFVYQTAHIIYRINVSTCAKARIDLTNNSEALESTQVYKDAVVTQYKLINFPSMYCTLMKSGNGICIKTFYIVLVTLETLNMRYYYTFSLLQHVGRTLANPQSKNRNDYYSLKRHKLKYDFLPSSTFVLYLFRHSLWDYTI